MNAIVFSQAGGGKTVNSTAVLAPARKKNLLICTDNSHIVLNNFSRPNLEVKTAATVKGFTDAYEEGYKSRKFDNIICDNLSDLIDLWLLELDASGKFKDFRQAYQLVYQSLKRLARESTLHDTNTIFTAWSDYAEIMLPTGEKTIRLQPKIPPKILDNVCGLMNVVAYVNTAEKDGKRRWYYALQGSQTLMVKDQVHCRASCLPEHLFVRPEQEAKA